MTDYLGRFKAIQQREPWVPKHEYVGLLQELLALAAAEGRPEWQMFLRMRIDYRCQQFEEVLRAAGELEALYGNAQFEAYLLANALLNKALALGSLGKTDDSIAA